MAVKLFGFTLGKKDIVREEKPEQASFTLPTEAIDDGAVTITQNAHYGTYVDLDGSVRNEIELITRYREMSNHPECDMAIDEIVNEAISHTEQGEIVKIVVDNLKQPEAVKKKIIEEFKNIQKMLNFSNLADDLFKRWYIDGRIYYHVIVNDKDPKKGIQELRYIDPRKIRKVREIQKERDPKTGANIIKSLAEYYVYNDRGTTTQTFSANVTQGLRIAPEAIINVNSGLMDAKNVFVISYLHKAIKALNQLRMIEDAVVIYRISRAPERRIFYIDVGNLPKGKSEEYMKNIMAKYRNKLVYDASTGAIKDDRKHMSMLEDFWLPRREGGRGTEISTLPGGENLGQIDDIIYFQKRLYRSLNVPINRLEQESQFSLGRSTEINRDELKFQKFIDRLRSRFNHFFYNILKKQLILKGIITEDDWNEWSNDILVDYIRDNHFSELKDAEILRERLQTLDIMQQYVGEFYSKEWVMKNVLHFDDDDIKQMRNQIDDELKSGEIGHDDDHINPAPQGDKNE